ncbi:MAG: MgtC/SapB family protein [Ilumatobacteraceae bacterium]
MLVHDLALFGRIALAAALGSRSDGNARCAAILPAPGPSLVAAGSAAFTSVAVDVFVGLERLIAGIVTGIGFIGAGVVLTDRSGRVRGLTTAAAIWSIASVGVIAGVGRFLLATLITALLLVLLELPKIPLLNAIDPDRWVDRFTSEDGDTPPDPYEAE